MPTVIVQAPAAARSPRLARLPPLALYVHLPWCVRKCPYCDFNSHEWRGDTSHAARRADSRGLGADLPEEGYVTALVGDLEHALPSVWGRKIGAIFFGGGTPSLFSPRSIEQLLAAFRARLPVAPDAEVTLEANPGTVEAGKFREFAQAGINRLSVGVQSFNPDRLRALGRIHDDREAHRAVEIARQYFPNFNLDLMYSLPGQTAGEARADVEAAVASGAPHLSFYQLTIEPNTLFHLNPPQLPAEEVQTEIQDRVARTLANAGYRHYEISAYARPGRECRHNLNYWRFGDYLGIGAGAHSKISFRDRVVRQMRHKQPTEYMRRAAAGAPVAEERVLERHDLAFEFAMNALRLTDGFPVALFTERTGLAITAVEHSLSRAEARGLLERDHAAVRPTELGRRFLNELLELFLPEAREPRTPKRGSPIVNREA